MPLIYPASRRSFYFLLVFHGTLASLRSAWDATSHPPHTGRQVHAFCYRFFDPADRPAPKLIGEIHLLTTACPALIAHEAVHAAIHYLRVATKRKKPPTGDDEEPLCYAAQAIVDQILKWQQAVVEGKA